MKEFSTVYRDRPLGPMKTAIYWVEYVIRHKGASHMRSPAAEMNFLQRNSLDVIAFLCFVVYIVVLFVKHLFRGFVIVVRRLKRKGKQNREAVLAKKVA